MNSNLRLRVQIWETAARLTRVADRILTALIVLCIICVAGFAMWGLWEPAEEAFLPDIPDEVLDLKPEDSGLSYDEYFDQLRETYPDIRAWLTIAGTPIDFPVVQGEDNFAYLNTAADKSYSIAGAIFLDNRNSSDFSDLLSIVYGHQMAHEKMFGPVKSFLDADYFNEHPSGKLYLPDGAYNLVFFACTSTDGYDANVYTPVIAGDTAGKERLLSYIKTISVQERDIEIPEDARIVGLSTCYSLETDGRIVLFGYLQKCS